MLSLLAILILMLGIAIGILGGIVLLVYLVIFGDDRFRSYVINLARKHMNCSINDGKSI